MNKSCPICHSVNATTIYTLQVSGQSFQVNNCIECAHVYTGFNCEILPDGLYEDDVYEVIDNRDSVYAKIMNLEYNRVLERIQSLVPWASSLLDFGSGKGVFLNLGRAKGFRVLGVETAKKRADFAEAKLGLKIIRKVYDDGALAAEKFDVITLFHVLEHLPQPKTLLQNLIAGNLKAEGLLVLEVPNFSSLQAGLAKQNWMHLDIPRHLSHFTKNRLKTLCGELNLEIVKSESFSLHLGVIGMCHSLLSIFGYKGKIIRDLKHYKKSVLLALLLVLPLGFLLEFTASLFKRGGIIRVYCLQKQ